MWYLIEDFFEHGWVRFFEADPVDIEALPLEGAGENCSRTQTVGVIVMEDLYASVRPPIDLGDRVFHGCDEIGEHHPPSSALNLSAKASRIPISAATSSAV